MGSISDLKKGKVHTRSIDVTIYDGDDHRIVVEGTLKDDRFHETYILPHTVIPIGAIHHISVYMLVNFSTSVIEDVEVDLKYVPLDVCWETSKSLEPIKGLSVTKGFTQKLKKLVGGAKSCTHILELLVAMAPAIRQGIITATSRQPRALTQERATRAIKTLTNTCHGWREGSPFVEQYKKLFGL